MSKQEELSAKDKLEKHLKSVLSEYHKDHMADSVKRGMLHRATNGYAVTRPPYGYSKTKTPGLFKINRHGKALREILMDFANGKTDVVPTIFNLAQLFNIHNVLCEQCIVARVKQIMCNPYYLGHIRYDGKLYNGLHESLFTEEEHMEIFKWVSYLEIYCNSLESFDKNIQSN